MARGWRKRNDRELVQDLKEIRRRLALSIRQTLADASEVRITVKQSEVVDEEFRLLQEAQNLLLESGIPLKRTMSSWEKEVELSSKIPLEETLGWSQ